MTDFLKNACMYLSVNKSKTAGQTYIKALTVAMRGKKKKPNNALSSPPGLIKQW